MFGDQNDDTLVSTDSVKFEIDYFGGEAMGFLKNLVKHNIKFTILTSFKYTVQWH